MYKCVASFGLIMVLSGCLQAAPSSMGGTNSYSKAPIPANNNNAGDSFDITSDDLSNALNDNNVIMLPYDPIEPKQVDYKTSVVREPTTGNNKLKSSSSVLERESSLSSSSSNVNQARRKPASPTIAESQGDDAERSGSPNVDKMKDIALNSREVRLVGPNQREVEMKDDLPTKVVVALENLQKEAQEVLGQMNEKLDKGWTEIKKSEVWGQVNEKLDKGWTELKSMVEGVVSPNNKSG